MNELAKRYFAVVGDNGFGYITSDGVVLESMRKLKNLTVMEMPSETIAYQYAVCAYVSRFVMRNYANGIGASVPMYLPPDELFIEADFEQREGSKALSYFPGIPM